VLTGVEFEQREAAKWTRKWQDYRILATSVNRRNVTETGSQHYHKIAYLRQRLAIALNQAWRNIVIYLI